MWFDRRRASLVRFFALVLAWAWIALPADAKPLTFTFRLPPSPQNPFQRELWAEVTTPSGRLLRLPVFCAGQDDFAVRALGDEVGLYRLGQITEGAQVNTVKKLAPTAVTVGTIQNAQAATRPFVQRDPSDPRKWTLSNHQPFVPFGVNLAWSDNTGLDFYRNAVPALGHVGLNWIRVWMAHWGSMNLDWLPDSLGPSPEPGTLDLRIAENWDTLLELAENEGVYVQVVLQHHGQYSTRVNANWSDNPWNVANPHGFLLSAADFFTSARARELTKWKYRYIIARWGASPAVMAWELFNEVQHTDAIKLEHNPAAVAAWHSEMATYLRSLDLYGHLITTSYEDLKSPVYSTLDYFQPHLYAANMLSNPREFDAPPPKLLKPVFYGEIGDDNMPLTETEKASGIALSPLVWASLMGTGRYPAELWLGEQMLKTGRLKELEAIARFLHDTHLAELDHLAPFSPAIESDLRAPFVLTGGHSWERRTPAVIDIPTDGKMPLTLSEIPRIFVGAPESIADGYPDRVTLRVTFPQSSTLTLHLADASPLGASARVIVDGYPVAHFEWSGPPTARERDQESDAPLPPPPPQPETPLPPRPTELTFSVPAGRHTLTLENPAGPSWFDFGSLDLGFQIPVLAAIGRRDATRVALWVWHRTAIFAPVPAGPPATGTLLIEDLPPGIWRIEWYDTESRNFQSAQEINHTGGTLKLVSPPIARQTALYLRRLDK